jgi:hypothetical protein
MFTVDLPNSTHVACVSFQRAIINKRHTTTAFVEIFPSRKDATNKTNLLSAALGSARCNPADMAKQFSRHLGRCKALARALQQLGLDRNTRLDIWLGYYVAKARDAN